MSGAGRAFAARNQPCDTASGAAALRRRGRLAQDEARVEPVVEHALLVAQRVAREGRERPAEIAAIGHELLRLRDDAAAFPQDVPDAGARPTGGAELARRVRLRPDRIDHTGEVE